jgi:hypothetical protein
MTPRNTCRFDGCTATVPEGIARCSAHRLLWVVGKPVEREPKRPWVRRMREGLGVAKDFSGRAA